jgi:cycloeucalenol cycloisomerase
MAAHKSKSAPTQEHVSKKIANTPGDVHPQAASTFFSSNSDKAWVEKFFLLYTPIWMSSMAYMMFSGAVSRWSDTSMLLHGIITGTPVFIIPLVIAPKFTQRPWHDSYWFKANLYLFIFGFFGNYFGTEYFFDMLGMTYRFPLVTTTLDSALVGRGEQTVPVIMYFYTHVYFMTYHVTANIALRQVMRLRLPAGRWVVFGTAVSVIGYVWAWLETKAMANPLMETQFYYEKMDVMLRFGSAIYATYFVASFPIWYFIDEEVERRWTVLQTASAAMSASMITFYLLDLSAQCVGSL